MAKQHQSIQQITRLKELKRSIRDGHSTVLSLAVVIEKAKAELQTESILIAHHLAEVKRILGHRYQEWSDDELRCKNFNRNDASRYIRLLRGSKSNTQQRITTNN